MDMYEIWWKHIIKTNYFLNQITSSLLGGKSIVLFLPSKIPWYDTMIELIKDTLHTENPNNSFDMIDCPEQEAGQYLLEKYCKREKRVTYRHGVGYAAFLGKSEDIVLNNRYIWVRNISEQKYKEWTDFIIEYNKNVGKDRIPALFILEIVDENISRNTKKGIETITFDQTINAYDIYTFCALISAKVNCKDVIKPYMADLVAHICRDDVELCTLCVKYGEKFLEKPLKMIHKIIEEEYRSDGSEFQFDGDEDTMKKCIWESQLKFLFPIIESYRSNFVAKHGKDLSKVLPIKNVFGETISEPQDLEIGMIFNIVRNGDLKIDTKQHRELELFKTARNSLAHMDILSLEEVKKILSWKG